MAYGLLAAPGTKLGPCLDNCQHTDCAATRAQAATVCVHCAKAIGYDTAFCFASDGVTLVHWNCELEATHVLAPEDWLKSTKGEG